MEAGEALESTVRVVTYKAKAVQIFPPEILHRIFKYCDPTTVRAIRQVSRSCHKMIEELAEKNQIKKLLYKSIVFASPPEYCNYYRVRLIKRTAAGINGTELSTPGQALRPHLVFEYMSDPESSLPAHMRNRKALTLVKDRIGMTELEHVHRYLGYLETKTLVLQGLVWEEELGALLCSLAKTRLRPTTIVLQECKFNDFLSHNLLHFLYRTTGSLDNIKLINCIGFRTCISPMAFLRATGLATRPFHGVHVQACRNLYDVWLEALIERLLDSNQPIYRLCLSVPGFDLAPLHRRIIQWFKRDHNMHWVLKANERKQVVSECIELRRSNLHSPDVHFELSRRNGDLGRYWLKNVRHRLPDDLQGADFPDHFPLPFKQKELRERDRDGLYVSGQTFTRIFFNRPDGAVLHLDVHDPE